MPRTCNAMPNAQIGNATIIMRAIRHAVALAVVSYMNVVPCQAIVRVLYCSVCGLFHVVLSPFCGTCFNIQLDVGASDAARFRIAASRWEAVITSDLKSFNTAGKGDFAQLPKAHGCKYPRVIDDLFVCASRASRDGPGGVVAWAGPYYVRKGGLPLVGVAAIDAADVSLINTDIIMHEIGHILGMGTLWRARNMTGPDGLKCLYNGRHANREYRRISGCTAIPTDLCSHWSEQCLVDELMTASSAINAEPMSRITVGGSQDLGYRVNYRRAGRYKSNSLDAGCMCRRPARFRGSQTDSPAGTPPPVTRARRLSNGAHQLALEAGRSILSERRVEASQAKSGGDNPDLTFVGDQVVSVLVQDGDGQIYGVVVRAED